ncbi:hypothetical protein ACFOET_09390 [Parapedobacter deserti]|uniref:Uncharacterized protein n=1 Tax=Parapedobacter deserti TaxID=1912957 RepID=A0ABV7JI88_9SPHI
MEVSKRIEVVLMLLVMVLMIGHDTVPHIHPHEHAWHHHHDYLGHHGCERGILDRLLEKHSHSDHSHTYSDTLSVLRYLKEQSSEAELTADDLSHRYPCTTIFYPQHLRHPKPFNTNVHLHANGLRAPPFTFC